MSPRTYSYAGGTVLNGDLLTANRAAYLGRAHAQCRNNGFSYTDWTTPKVYEAHHLWSQPRPLPMHQAIGSRVPEALFG